MDFAGAITNGVYGFVVTLGYLMAAFVFFYLGLLIIGLVARFVNKDGKM